MFQNITRDFCHAAESLLTQQHLSQSFALCVSCSSGTFWDKRALIMLGNAFHLYPMWIICFHFHVESPKKLRTRFLCHKQARVFYNLSSNHYFRLNGTPPIPPKRFCWNCHKSPYPLFSKKMTSQSIAEISIGEIKKPVFRLSRLHSSAQDRILVSTFGWWQGLFHWVLSLEADSWSQQRKDQDTHNKDTTEWIPNADKAERKV